MIRALVADGTTVLLTTDSAAAANGAAATRGRSAREGG